MKLRLICGRTVLSLLLIHVKERDLGVSQSLRSASERPEPTGKSVSEARKIQNVQTSLKGTVEPAATTTAAAAVNRK